jgi:glycosyltransferase involved in cell wall biosynthesis
MTILRVTLVTLGDPARLTGGYLYHRHMAELASENRAALSFVSFPDWRFPLPALGGAGVSRQIGAQRSDVVVIDSIVAAFAAPWLRRFPARLAAIVHQSPGGVGHGPVRGTIQRKFDLITYRNCERIVVASETSIDELMNHGIHPERIALIAPGRDVALKSGVAPDLRLGRRSAALCVANWSEHKGILELLSAFSLVPEALCTLHLVGDENADPRYAARVGELLVRSDLAGRVIRHGPLPPEEVGAMYKTADLFVLPSIREAYGTVYGEAMAAGLPVVGLNIGNLTKLARQSRDGFLLEPGDVAGLAEAITKICRDDELRDRMARSAKERAGSFPTWDESADRFFSVLRSLAAMKK